jgi:hypothetical protein
MGNLLEILRFDLAEQARRRANYVFFAVLFGLALLASGRPPRGPARAGAPGRAPGRPRG